MSSTTPSTTQSSVNIDLSSLSSPTFSASSYLNDFLSTIPSTSLKPALQNLSLQTNLEIQRTHTHLQTLQRRVLSVLQGAPQSLSRASSSLARVSEAQTVLQGGVDELPEAPEATSRLMDLHSRLEELEVMEKTMEGITRFEDTSRMVAKNIAGRDIEEGEFKEDVKRRRTGRAQTLRKPLSSNHSSAQKNTKPKPYTLSLRSRSLNFQHSRVFKPSKPLSLIFPTSPPTQPYHPS